MGAENAYLSTGPLRGAQRCMNGVTFDAGGLIALERNDRRVLSLLAAAVENGYDVLVPATALAQVIRNPAKQVRLWRLVQRDRTEVVPLDAAYAQAVGALLSRSGTANITDAHVIACARRAGHAVITSDPRDLRRLDPGLRVIAV